MLEPLPPLRAARRRGRFCLPPWHTAAGGQFFPRAAPGVQKGPSICQPKHAQSAARSGAFCLGALKKGLSPHSFHFFHLAADVAAELMEAYQRVKRNHAVPVAEVQKNRSFSLRLNSVLFENRRFSVPVFSTIGGQTLFGQFQLYCVYTKRMVL